MWIEFERKKEHFILLTFDSLLPAIFKYDILLQFKVTSRINFSSVRTFFPISRLLFSHTSSELNPNTFERTILDFWERWLSCGKLSYLRTTCGKSRTIQAIRISERFGGLTGGSWNARTLFPSKFVILISDFPKLAVTVKISSSVIKWLPRIIKNANF